MGANEGSQLLDAAKKVFLFGNSEGGVVVARYHHSTLDAKLSGRIIYSTGCDYSYFMPCMEAARICGHQCRKDVPQLNMIGDKDDYFGRHAESLASKVAVEGGYGGPITGNCRAEYDNYGFAKSTVVEVKEAGHGISYWDDNLMRGVFADFLNDPTKDNSQWASLAVDRCKLENGVYRCDQEEKQPCDTDTWTQTVPPTPFDTKGTPPDATSCVTSQASTLV